MITEQAERTASRSLSSRSADEPQPAGCAVRSPEPWTSISSDTPTPTSEGRTSRRGAGSSVCIPGTARTAAPGGQAGSHADLRVLDHDAARSGRTPSACHRLPVGRRDPACGPAPRRRRSVTSNGSLAEVGRGSTASTMSASRRGRRRHQGGGQAGVAHRRAAARRARAPGDAGGHQLRRLGPRPSGRRPCSCCLAAAQPEVGVQDAHRRPHARRRPSRARGLGGHPAAEPPRRACTRPRSSTARCPRTCRPCPTARRSPAGRSLSPPVRNRGSATATAPPRPPSSPCARRSPRPGRGRSARPRSTATAGARSTAR